jgi:hypothetical protein
MSGYGPSCYPRPGANPAYDAADPCSKAKPSTSTTPTTDAHTSASATQPVIAEQVHVKANAYNAKP